jgi:hypothetical protein
LGVENHAGAGQAAAPPFRPLRGRYPPCCRPFGRPRNQTSRGRRIS